MFPQQSEMLARAKLADISRAADPRPRRRSSLRIVLDARRARRANPAG